MDLPLPIGPRATITPALLDALVRRYGLDSIRSATDLGGAYNLNAAIETPRG
jgi:hypothetical protein